jgi:dCTP deaminase
MILSDRDILREIEAGRIRIDPLERECVQPSSVDLHLGNKLLLFRNSHRPYIDVREPADDLMEMHEVAYGDSIAVHPLEVLLASTYETITLPEDLVARLEGKSSLARLGLQVHATAGFVDPGWEGYLTLELSNVTKFPILIYPGMKIVQISFMRMSSPVLLPYGSTGLHSKYQGESGPTPSRYYQEFASGRAMAQALRAPEESSANGANGRERKG